MGYARALTAGDATALDDAAAAFDGIGMRAVAADAASASLLEVEPGSPLLLVERVSMTYGDRAVELRRGLYATTRHHYRNALG